MSRNRLGADEERSRVPKRGILDLVAGGDQIVLHEEDECVLDGVWV